MRSLFAPVPNPKLEALAKKIGTKDDPIQIAAQLAAKVAVMEKKNEVLEKRLAAQSNATPDADTDGQKWTRFDSGGSIGGI